MNLTDEAQRPCCSALPFLSVPTAGKGPLPGDLRRESLLSSLDDPPGAHLDAATSSFFPQGAEADGFGGVHPYRRLHLPGTCAQGTCLTRIRASAAITTELTLLEYFSVLGTAFSSHMVSIIFVLYK